MTSTPQNPPLQTPHDALIKYAFSDLTRAAQYLASVLSAEQNEHIDWSSLELVTSSFVSPQLAQRFSDLLYEVQLDGRMGFVYVLLEHQSTDEPWMLLRLLEYMTAIWLRWVSQNPKAPFLPPLIPIVLTHTEKGGWKARAKFHDLFAPTPMFELLKGNTPSFAHVLDDLTRQNDEQIRSRMNDAYATLALLLLRHGRRKIDLAKWLKQNAADLLRKVWQHPRGRDLLTTLIRYIHSVGQRTKPADLNDAVGSILDAEARTMSMTIAEQLIQQGKLEGRREGLRQAIEDLCEAFGVELNDIRRAQLEALDLAGLNAVRTALKEQRGWPELHPP